VTADPAPSFVVEYPCETHCRIEVDLAGTHLRFTLRQMQQLANIEHDKAHRPPPVSAPIYDGLAATFRSPASR
jgi:hypothetical protein